MLAHACYCNLGKQESFVFRSAWATKSDQSEKERRGEREGQSGDSLKC